VKALFHTSVPRYRKQHWDSDPQSQQANDRGPTP